MSYPAFLFRPNVLFDDMSQGRIVIFDELSRRRNGFRRNVMEAYIPTSKRNAKIVTYKLYM